jgi:cell wall-associated NlpC family hydrolase
VKKQFLVITVPVENLRKEPVVASSGYLCDDLQETQLLYNECLLYKGETEDWYHVEAIEQKKAISRGDWQGYPGWIQKTSAAFIDRWPELNVVVKRAQAPILKTPLRKAESLLTLSMGTRLTIENGAKGNYFKTTLPDGQQGWIKKDDVYATTPVTDMQRLRSSIIRTAKMLLGVSYLWGGRSCCAPSGIVHSAQGRKTRLQVTSRKSQEKSMYKPRTLNVEPQTVSGVLRGVDCSSLINLAYRVNWVDIPRDAHDQWRVSTEIACHTLLPADLIFISAQETHNKITHVMMHLAGEEFIEALETGSVVTINTFKNKFGLTLREAAQQDLTVNKRKIYLGSILKPAERNG